MPPGLFLFLEEVKGEVWGLWGVSTDALMVVVETLREKEMEKSK